jgi:hypothetical protein
LIESPPAANMPKVALGALPVEGTSARLKERGGRWQIWPLSENGLSGHDDIADFAFSASLNRQWGSVCSVG